MTSVLFTKDMFRVIALITRCSTSQNNGHRINFLWREFYLSTTSGRVFLKHLLMLNLKCRRTGRTRKRMMQIANAAHRAPAYSYFDKGGVVKFEK